MHSNVQARSRMRLANSRLGRFPYFATADYAAILTLYNTPLLYF